MITTIAWRNLWRRRQRTLLTALAMGIGVGLAMGMMALQAGIFSEVFDEMVTDSLGHIQVHHADYPSARHLHDTLKDIEGLVHQSEALNEVRVAAPRLLTVALAGGKERSSGALIMGVDPTREVELSEIDQEVRRGRWLSETNLDGPEQVVLGARLAEELALDLGDELAIVGQDAYGGVAQGLYRIVGLVDSGMVELDQSGVWISLSNAQSLFALKGQAHELLIAGGADRSSAMSFGEGREQVQALKLKIASLIRKHRQPSKLEPLLVQTWREAKPSVSRLIDTQRSSAYVMLAIVLALAAIGVLNTMLMAIYERTRELGVMLAIGVRPLTISALVLVEALYLATIAAIIGLMLGGLIDTLLIQYGLDFSVNGEGLSYGGIRLSSRLYGVFEPSAIILALAALYGMTALAALWPAWRASRLEPVDAINRGAS